MQQGLNFLWLLALGTSCLVWGYRELSLRQHGGSGHRQRLSGCELARQVLDQHDFKRVRVTAVPRRDQLRWGHRGEELFLSEKVYSGTTLKDLSLALHETVHFLEEPRGMMPSGVKLYLTRISQGGVLISWLLVLGSFFLGQGPIFTLGQAFFVLVFFFACASLPEEGRVMERARDILLRLEGFEVDERARMSRILGTFQGWPLAQILYPPLSKNGLPKFERIC